MVISAGFAEDATGEGPALQQAMLDAARPHTLRIVGPNCLGVMSPRLRLDATFAPIGAKPGSLALVTQSGAIMTGILDWASARNIGFSHLVSVGAMADVDFGDLLDYLAQDAGTASILLYVEALTHARKFMSAARAASRHKPVIVLKAGRFPKALGPSLPIQERSPVSMPCIPRRSAGPACSVWERCARCSTRPNSWAG